MRNSPLLLFCLKAQFYFGTTSAVVLFATYFLFGKQVGDRFCIAGISALLYSVIVYFAIRHVRGQKTFAKLFVLLVTILNGASALRIAFELPSKLKEATLITSGSLVCIIWFTGLTAIVCSIELMRKETNMATEKSTST